MDLQAIPLFNMLRGKLGYLTQRQQLIAENVANADTPGYTPRDLKPFEIQRQVATQTNGTRLLTSDPRHMAGTGAGGASASHAYVAQVWTPEKTPDAETTLNGNQVSLEDQMVKVVNHARILA